MLRYVLTVLEDKGDLQPVEPQEPDSLYEKETQFIGEQIGKAEKRITEYLFRVASVIQLEDLKGENMLIHLYLAREMAKKISMFSPFRVLPRRLSDGPESSGGTLSRMFRTRPVIFGICFVTF